MLNNKIPEHIQKRIDNNENVSVMQWEPEKTFDQIAAATVTKFVKWIHKEFLSLLHTTKDTDIILRNRMLKFEPVESFASKFPTVFEKITTREIATNPRLLAPIFFQLEILQKVQSGEMSNDQAKSSIAEASLAALKTEMNK